MRKPIVGVMGGSKAAPEVAEKARRLGELIAERGWVLLNGGRNSGVMAASAKGAKDAIRRGAKGLVIGILPDTTTTKAAPGLDIVVLTGMGDGRNLINVMSSDVVIACPGELGTLSEIVLALKHNKRVIELAFEAGLKLDKYRKRGQLTHADTPEDAVEQAAAALAAGH